MGDVSVGVRGENFSYLFSTVRLGMESLVRDGAEWLYRTPQPAFWRALTDNDRGNKFALKSAMWMGADCFIKCAGVVVSVDGREIGVPLAPANNMYEGALEAEHVLIAYTLSLIHI